MCYEADVDICAAGCTDTASEALRAGRPEST